MRPVAKAPAGPWSERSTPTVRLVWIVAQGTRWPGIMRWMTCWLFQRNWAALVGADRSGCGVAPARLRGGGFEQLEQLFERFLGPVDFLARREALAAEVPFAAEHLPGHHVFGVLADALGELAEARDGLVEERPERGRVDLVPTVGGDLHFLERAAEVLALHARAVAVGFDLGDVVERLEGELLGELVAVEGALGGAELELARARARR